MILCRCVMPHDCNAHSQHPRGAPAQVEDMSSDTTNKTVAWPSHTYVADGIEVVQLALPFDTPSHSVGKSVERDDTKHVNAA